MKSHFSIQPMTIWSGMLISSLILIFGIFGCSDQNNTVLPGEQNEFKQVGEAAAITDTGQELQAPKQCNPFPRGYCTWYAAHATSYLHSREASAQGQVSSEACPFFEEADSLLRVHPNLPPELVRGFPQQVFRNSLRSPRIFRIGS